MSFTAQMPSGRWMATKEEKPQVKDRSNLDNDHIKLQHTMTATKKNDYDVEIPWAYGCSDAGWICFQMLQLERLKDLLKQTLIKAY